MSDAQDTLIYDHPGWNIRNRPITCQPTDPQDKRHSYSRAASSIRFKLKFHRVHTQSPSQEHSWIKAESWCMMHMTMNVCGSRQKKTSQQPCSCEAWIGKADKTNWLTPHDNNESTTGSRLSMFLPQNLPRMHI